MSNDPQEALFDVTAEREAKAKLAIARAQRDVLGVGPIYQGVAKQIRWLTATGAEAKDADGQERTPVINKDEYAGLIALARSLARAVDQHTGHNLTGWVEKGSITAPLAEQLSAVMTVLRGDESGDGFEDWLNDPDAPKENADGGTSSRAH